MTKTKDATRQASIEADDGYLVIRLPLHSEPKRAFGDVTKEEKLQGVRKGSTRLVAGTGGFLLSTIQMNGSPVKVSCNATIPYEGPEDWD